MHNIPLHEYTRRLRRWETEEDRRHVETQDDRGRRVVEYWSLGVCRLRAVYFRDGVELYADKGVPRWRVNERKQVGKIAFHYFGDAGP